MVTLNFDILILVFEHLALPDLLHLSTLSRAAHASATAKSLRTLTLTSPAQLSRTSTYILSAHTRAPLVRTLSIAYSAFYAKERYALLEGSARAVWRLLEHTTELRALHVERIDRLLAAEPRVRDAIARLRFLDVLGFLKLQGVGDAATLTSNLRSKPRKVILDCRTSRSSGCDGYFVSHSLSWFVW